MSPKNVSPPFESEIARIRGAIVSSLEHAVENISRQTQVFEDPILDLTLASTVGPRRERNEDRACAVRIMRGRQPADQVFVAVVCDGMPKPRHAARA